MSGVNLEIGVSNVGLTGVSSVGLAILSLTLSLVCMSVRVCQKNVFRA